MRVFISGIFILLSLILAPAAALAQESADDFTETLANAEKGDAQAQFDVGYVFATGEGVEQDEVRAFFWYEKAAAQNHTSAQYKLGMAYLHGEGVSSDLQKALDLITLAADKNLAEAQYDLAVLYDEGKGTAEDNGRAGVFKGGKTRPPFSHV
jgi:uncharacterized protein